MTKKAVAYILTVLIFTFGIGGLFSIKTRGAQDYFSDDDINVDKQYISEIKDILGEYYMRDSGITLTKISEDGSFTEYKVEIHTGRTNSAEMIERIRALSPNKANCSACVVFSGKE